MMCEECGKPKLTNWCPNCGEGQVFWDMIVREWSAIERHKLWVETWEMEPM